MTTNKIKSLSRTRWVIRVSLVLVSMASIGVNVLHAKPNGPSQFFNAWAPTTVVIAIEIISRVPFSTTSTKIMRWGRAFGAFVLGAIAAVVSYLHMFGSIVKYNGYETLSDKLTAWLLPGTFDGLMVVLSITLVEANRQIRDLGAIQVGADLRLPRPETGPPPAKTNLTKKEQVARILTRYPHLSVQEIANRVGSSYNYTQALVRQLRSEDLELVTSA